MVITYKPQATDTTVEADQLLFSLLAQRTNKQRMEMTTRQIQSGRALSLSGLKHQFGYLDAQRFAHKVAQAWLGERWPAGFKPKGDPMTWTQDSIGLARRLHAIFTDLGIQYYVTGGIASTTYGEPRFTSDLDLVINASGDDLYPLVTTLETDGFYVPGVDDAVSGRMKTLQITDQETIERADLVITNNEEWDSVKFSRRQLIDGIYLASPEDVVLNKLRWGKRSQSEKQWRDVLGVLKVQGDNLDFDYMQKWASRLGLADDLSGAAGEAGMT
ncbi:MAG: hypothetical protein F6K31_06685 [Symploca sp. SIO2G7]|nr:hypothetical protein [Symploca sp. SIO2G7]